MLLDPEQLLRARSLPPILVHTLGLQEGLVLLHLLLHKVLHDACVEGLVLLFGRPVLLLWILQERVRVPAHRRLFEFYVAGRGLALAAFFSNLRIFVD